MQVVVILLETSRRFFERLSHIVNQWRSNFEFFYSISFIIMKLKMRIRSRSTI